jgi:hypothetical protein
MTKPSQKRAVANNRRRLGDRGMSRFEVRGLEADKELVRTLAQRLARNDDAARKLRVEVSAKVSDAPASRGGIFRALRDSPLVGADIHFERDQTTGRDFDL